MNKQKFEAKVKELYAYEDETYAKFCEMIKPYNEELRNKDCEIVCKLFWWYPHEIDDISYERLPIHEKQTYHCNIIFQFQKIGSDDSDEENNGFRVIDDVSSYGFGVNFWALWSFKKHKCDYATDNVRKYYIKVMEQGWEAVAKEIPE